MAQGLWPVDGGSLGLKNDLASGLTAAKGEWGVMNSMCKQRKPVNQEKNQMETEIERPGDLRETRYSHV